LEGRDCSAAVTRNRRTLATVQLSAAIKSRNSLVSLRWRMLVQR